MRTLCGTILTTLAVSSLPLLAATVSYTPQGSAPYYYWSDTAAWGGTLPGASDEAVVNSSTLLANPLIIGTGASPAVTTGRLGNGVLQVEEGGSLSVSGSLLMADYNQTSIVTNYGTMSVLKLAMGIYSDEGGTGKGDLAQFDNFGTLNIGTHFRIGIRGTRSIFYNHEGAKFNKTGGGQYTFYLSTDSGGDSTIINEGTMVCGSGTETWTGNNDAKNEIIMRKSGTFDPGPVLKIGHAGNSTTRINLYDNSKLLGSTQYRVGGTSGTKGYITLSNESSIVTSGYMYLGYEANTIGSLALADNARASLRYTSLGRSSSQGMIALSGNSSLVVDSGSSEFGVGYGAGSSGSLSLGGSATADIRSPFYIGLGTAARGAVSLVGNSQLFATNNSIVVGYNSGATGTLHVADNAVLHAPLFRVGQTDKVGTTGYATFSGNATLFSTNILIPAWGSKGQGTLEVADNAVITNLQYLKIGLNGNSNPQAVKMRGGTIYFDVDPENSIYVERGYYDPLFLNENRTVVRGFVRGWGKIAFSDPRTYVTESKFDSKGRAAPCGIVHYGQIIADGEGVMRDLDFSRFGSLHYNTTDANPSGTNGWFAVNKGRLKLPRCLPNRSGYKCVGDSFDDNVDLGGTSRRLANIFNYEFTGATLNHFVFSELYATDRDDIPSGLDELEADKIIAVWRIGYFSDGPEVDEPTNPSAFTSAKLKFKYSPEGLDGLNFVHVYRHDGSADGKWERCGRMTAPSTTMPVVSSRAFAPSSENWNVGWFAIVGRVERPAATLMILR